MTTQTTETTPMIVGGRARASTGATMEVRAPWDDATVATVATATPGDVDDALAAAVAALPKTAALDRAERAAILEAMADALGARDDELARTLVHETGKTIRDARAEVVRAISTLRFCAGAARELVGEVLPLDALGGVGARWAMTLAEPIGVVVGIPAVNYPLLIAAHKIGPAIGAGCPVLLKPPDRAPLTSLAIAEVALEAGWPAGAVSVLPGGPDVGQALTTDPRVRLVSFTGSSAAGRAIAGQVGMARVILELGSNSATIVDRTADLDAALARCAAGGFAANGQSCISVQRVYVHRERHDAFVDGLADDIAALRTGDPYDEQVDVGPVVDDRAAEHLERLLRDAREQGAQIRVGGERRGRMVDPTLVVGLTPQMLLHREEAFGPVIAVAAFDRIDEAIDQVNDSRYGLQAGVFTDSLETALDAARRLRVGGVHVNEVSTFRPDHMPYGGVKDSGLGKEGPRYAMHEMTSFKAVSIKTTGRPTTSDATEDPA